MGIGMISQLSQSQNDNNPKRTSHAQRIAYQTTPYPIGYSNFGIVILNFNGGDTHVQNGEDKICHQGEPYHILKDGTRNFATDVTGTLLV